MDRFAFAILIIIAVISCAGNGGAATSQSGPATGGAGGNVSVRTDPSANVNSPGGSGNSEGTAPARSRPDGGSN